MIEPLKSRTRGQAKRCGRVAIATIEPLEARVAPASLTFTDVDGDLVTVTTSKGSNIELAAIVTKANEGIGEELHLINFALNSATQAAFAGTNLTVTAKRTSLGGDGFVNVGYIEAIGIDLGKVVIRGDLGVIDAGDGVSATSAIKSLSVQSLGRFGLDTGAPDLKSDIDGRVGKLVVKSDVDQAFVRVIDSGGANGKIGSITIGGSVIGGVAGSSGRIDSDDGIGPVRIGGGIVGGAGINSGRLFSGGDFGPVKIAGSVLAGSANETGAIFSDGKLASLTIGGSVIGGDGDYPASLGQIRSSGTTGPVRIAGSLIGAAGDYSGSIDGGPLGDITAVTVGGSVIGGAGLRSGAITTGQAMGAVKIKGDLRGGPGTNSGTVAASVLASVTLGGSLVGGSNDSTDFVSGNGQISASAASQGIGFVRIVGDIVGGSLSGDGDLLNSGTIGAAAGIGRLFVGGSIIAGTDNGNGVLTRSGAINAGFFGAITVKGSLVGNATHRLFLSTTGEIIFEPISGPAIRKLTVGGQVEQTDIFAGYSSSKVGVNADAQIGKVTVGGDWIASNLVAGVDDVNGKFGDGDDAKLSGGIVDDAPGVVSRIASILIKGQALGTPSMVNATDHFGFVAQQIGSFKVGATKFSFTAGAGNDTAGFVVGATGDLRVREVAAP
jgi:hypothetical protein